MNQLRNLLKFCSLCLSALLASRALGAGTAAQSMTLDGVLYAAGTTVPLTDAAASLKIQILDPSKTCVLYEEAQTVNTAISPGYFNIQVGSFVGSSHRTTGAGADPGNAMAAIFGNVPLTAIPAAANGNCSGGYLPAAGDVRYLRITVTPSATGIADTLSPDMTIGSVPSALVAESVPGISYVGGNIGIATASPAQPLDVTGNAHVSGSVLFGTQTDVSSLNSYGLLVRPQATNTQGGLLVTPSVGGNVSTIAVFNNSGLGNGFGQMQMTATDFFAGTFGAYPMRLQTSNTTQMSILANGNVGIGQTTPLYKLDVLGSGGTTVANFSDGTASCSVTPSTVGSVSCSSDERLKTDIQNFDDQKSLKNILHLQTVTYRWKSDQRFVHTGFIAQEVEAVAPELVREGADGYKQISYGGFIPWIAGAIKALASNWSDDSAKLHARLDTLAEQNKVLQKQLNEQALRLKEQGDIIRKIQNANNRK